MSCLNSRHGGLFVLEHFLGSSSSNLRKSPLAFLVGLLALLQALTRSQLFNLRFRFLILSRVGLSACLSDSSSSCHSSSCLPASCVGRALRSRHSVAGSAEGEHDRIGIERMVMGHLRGAGPITRPAVVGNGPIFRLLTRRTVHNRPASVRSTPYPRGRPCAGAHPLRRSRRQRSSSPNQPPKVPIRRGCGHGNACQPIFEMICPLLTAP